MLQYLLKQVLIRIKITTTIQAFIIEGSEGYFDEVSDRVDT